nr:PREDICTED: granulocyte colony-stimulating factor isoform X2 [Bos indicus]
MKLMGECLGPGRGELRQQRAGVPGLPERSALLLSPHLLSVLQLLLWHSALWTVHEATPLGPARSLPQSFLLKCLEQVRKIQADGAELQERLCAAHKLCHPEELMLLRHSLGIPQAPLSSCSSQSLQLMEDLGAAPAVQPTQGAMPTFTSAFQRRAGGVLVASQLHRFLELAYRGLRYLAEP